MRFITLSATIFGACLVFALAFSVGAALAQSPQPQDLTSQLEEAQHKAAMFEAQAAYKDFLLAQKDFDALYQQFLAADPVKQVQAKLAENRMHLQEIEQRALAAADKKKEEWFLDFSTGELKPVPKKP